MSNNLRSLRGSMTQVEFAKKIGLSQRVYSAYETGAQELKSNLIIRICKEFGCSAEWLLGFNESMTFVMSTDELELLNLYRRCDHSRKKRTLEDLRDRADASELKKSEVGFAPPEGMESDRRKVV